MPPLIKKEKMMDNNKAKKAVELAMMAKLMADASKSKVQANGNQLFIIHRMGTVPANMYSPGNMMDGSPLAEARAVARELMP